MKKKERNVNSESKFNYNNNLVKQSLGNFAIYLPPNLQTRIMDKINKVQSQMDYNHYEDYFETIFYRNSTSVLRNSCKVNNCSINFKSTSYLNDNNNQIDYECSCFINDVLIETEKYTKTEHEAKIGCSNKSLKVLLDVYHRDIQSISQLPVKKGSKIAHDSRNMKKTKTRTAKQINESIQDDINSNDKTYLNETNCSFGAKLLTKMGWKGDGYGLGAQQQGIKTPIRAADPQNNRRGFGATSSFQQQQSK
jgi:hypothetical protein